MGILNVCPSASAVMKAINLKKPELAETLVTLAESHSTFVSTVHKLREKTSSSKMKRDLSVAITQAEDAFAWALKGIGDDVLRDKEESGTQGSGVIIK